MAGTPTLSLTSTVLDAPDANELAAFYRRLLGWPVRTDEPGWVTLAAPGGGPGLAFQTEPAYVRPVWPAGPGEQQMQMHLDVEVDESHDVGPCPAEARGGDPAVPSGTPPRRGPGSAVSPGEGLPGRAPAGRTPRR